MSTVSRRRALTLRVSVVFVAVLAVATAGAGGYVYLHLDHNIRTFSTAGVARSRPPAAVAATTTAGLPAAQPALNLLLIGSDTRVGGNIALGGGAEVDGARSDTTILLHVSGDRKHAVGVSIPRDALVDVPACEADGQSLPAQQHVMFNSAFAQGNLPAGNPTCTQNTVEAMTGIRVDHTIVVDFSGFSAMSAAVGGVPVCVPAVNSTWLEHEYGVTLTPGPQTVSGKQALEYVRAREGFGDNSDIGRMKRQQAFMAALVKKIIDSDVYTDPLALYRLADAATGALTVDPSLGSVTALVDLAEQMKSVPLANLEFVTTPWTYDGARVDLVDSDVSVLWSLLRADRTLEGRDVSGAVSAAGSASATVPDGAVAPLSQSPSTAASATGAAAAAATSGAATAPASADASGTPSPIPTGITDNVRSAASDPCADLNYGQ